MTKSQLKAQLRRALAPEDKTQRRAAILEAAEGLLRKDPSASFSVEELARRSGLAKGTVYLYFRTREEVLLALHEKHAHEAFDVIERALTQPHPTGPGVVGESLRFLRESPGFYPLAANCRAMLDTNVSTERALEFKVGIGTRLAQIGTRLEAVLPGLLPGEGAALLMNSYALIIGLWQQADPPLSLRAVMARPEMRIFRIDFEKQLSAALVDLWEAAERRGAGRTS